MIFSDFYFHNLTRFCKISISGIKSSSQTFYYLIWKNSEKVTKSSKKPKGFCQKVSQNILISTEGLSKFAEGLSSHYVQLCFFLYSLHNCFLFVFRLFFVQFIIFSFILCTIALCAIMIFPFLSSSEWNKI